MADYARLLKRFAFGATKLTDISKADIKKKLAKLDKVPSEQFHALVAIKVFFRFVVRQDYLDHSPCEGVEVAGRIQSRDRVLSESELAAVYKASLDEPYPWGPIVSLLILTGQRRGEIAHLQWDWIDTEAKTITFPTSITKNKREHTIPYGDLTAAVLERIPEIKDSPYLFPASKVRRKGQAPSIFGGWSKSKKAFDEKLEGLEPYRLHDLRRTFSTTLASLGVPQIVVEKLLNHVSGGEQSPIARVYNRHSYLEEMREAISAYENWLNGIQER